MNVSRWTHHHWNAHSRVIQDQKKPHICFCVSFFAASHLIGDKLGKEFYKPLNNQLNIRILPKEPRRCRMQPKKKASPSGARLSDCPSVCHRSSRRRHHVGDDDAWILWPRSRLSEHLQTHVSLDVRIDRSYSVTDAPTCPRHIPMRTVSQPGEAKMSLSSQAVMQGGGRRRWGMWEGVDQGQHRLYLVLAPALVLQSMFICLWCDENSVSSRRFLRPRTRLTAYVHSQKSSYMCAVCLGNLAFL